jgi:Protein of unknown function (DUF4244)
MARKGIRGFAGVRRPGRGAERVRHASRLRYRLAGLGSQEAGMSTAEYAIGTIAAAAFGALLYTVVTGDSVVSALTQIIQRALSVSF